MSAHHLFTVATSRLFQLLATTGLREILRANGWPPGPEPDEDELDDYDDEILFNMRTRRGGRRRRPNFVWPKVPSEAGTKLMASGHFGTNPYYVDRIKKRKQAFATNLMWRELGVDSHGVRMRADQSIFQVRTDRRICQPRRPNVICSVDTNFGIFYGAEHDSRISSRQDHPLRFQKLFRSILR